MHLQPDIVDPNRLFRPSTVAGRIGVNASMVTHWMQRGDLDYVVIDGQKLIPEESIKLLEERRAGLWSGSVSLDPRKHEEHAAKGERHPTTCGLCDDEDPDA